MALGTNALLLVIDEPADDLVRVTARGELDMLTVDELAETVIAARGDCARVRLDLSRLDFMDSVGVTLLLHLRLIAREEGWTLDLVRPREHVWRVVEFLGLGASLPGIAAGRTG